LQHGNRALELQDQLHDILRDNGHVGTHVVNVSILLIVVETNPQPVGQPSKQQQEEQYDDGSQYAPPSPLQIVDIFFCFEQISIERIAISPAWLKAPAFKDAIGTPPQRDDMISALFLVHKRE
jgi:hypothetical protein